MQLNFHSIIKTAASAAIYIAALCLCQFGALAQTGSSSQAKKAELPNIHIVATGGTIAGSGSSAVNSAYTAGAVGIESLINAVPQMAKIANITGEQIVNIGSQDMDDATMLLLSKKIQMLLANDEIDGIVVTHGTDTMEETAYFLTLTLHSQKPVVLTGAMRPSTAMSADGPLNLYNAVVTAAEPTSAGKGVLVAMNEKIFDAGHVTKTNTTAVETFASPEYGPIGRIHNGKAVYTQETLYRHTTQSKFNISGLESLPKVGIAYGYSNADSLVVSAFIQNGYKGIVYAGVGNGNIHKNVFPSLIKARKEGIAVVRSSRVPTGETTLFAEVDDAAFGFAASRRLNPQKARILLQLALTVSCEPDVIQEIFNKY